MIVWRVNWDVHSCLWLSGRDAVIGGSHKKICINKNFVGPQNNALIEKLAFSYGQNIQEMIDKGQTIKVRWSNG